MLVCGSAVSVKHGVVEMWIVAYGTVDTALVATALTIVGYRAIARGVAS